MRKGGVRKARTLVTAVGLVVINAIIYAAVRGHDYVGLDDVGYVRDNANVNAGLTWHGVAWAFTTGFAANWHPLTWLSHMVDVELFGTSAGPQLVVNVIFHAANSLLLFGLLARATGALGRSGFVAFLFAAHPLHVESVAWVAERKDVLSTFLWLLTMWAYLAYVKRPGLARYFVVCVTFALGLMAKPMLVTLPFALLLFDGWPLGRAPMVVSRSARTRWLELVREKLPLFGLAALSSVVTFVAQRQGGAMSTTDVLPIAGRVANALVGYATYIGKMLLPINLSVFYPHPRSFSISQVALAVAVLGGISYLVWRLGKSRPYLAVGWLWYLGTLVPVIGIVQVGTQAIADRYTYVPLIGLFIVIVWGVTEIFVRLSFPRAASGLATAAIVLLAADAQTQVAAWANAETLWTHALHSNPNNYRAHNSLGVILADRGEAAAALSHFNDAARLEPGYPEVHNNLGVAAASRGQFAEAISHYTDALRLNPAFADAHNNLGLALAREGQLDEAVSHYATALRLQSDFPEAQNSISLALIDQGKFADAELHAREALRARPAFSKAKRSLGLALFRQGRAEAAVSEYLDALRIDPRFAEVHNDLGFALMAQNKMEDAKAHFGEAIRLKPDLAEAHSNLGFLLAGQGQIAGAIEHLSDAVRLKPDFEAARVSLGMALGAAARFDDARAQFLEALRLNPKNEGAQRGLDAVTKARGG